MDWSIGQRIKSRNRERLEVVNKRKKEEDGVMVCVKKQRKKRATRSDFLEDLTPTTNTNVLPALVNDKKLCNVRIEYQQDKSVKESFSRVFRDLEFGKKSVPSSSGLRDLSVQHIGVNEKLSGPFASSSGLWNVSEGVNEKLSAPPRPVEIWDIDLEIPVPSSTVVRDVFEPTTVVVNEVWDLDLMKSVPSSSGLRDNNNVSEKNTNVMEKGSSASDNRLDVEKSVPREIEEISSDSDSETKETASAKKKEDNRTVESISSDDTSESEDEEEVNQVSEDSNSKDKVESLSAEGPSSSSSSSGSSSSSSSTSSSGEDDSDDNVVRKPPSPVKRVVKPQRRPVGRPKGRPVGRNKRSASCLPKPRKQVKKPRKLNRREEEVEEVGKAVVRVTKPQSDAVFVCTHCGKENTGTPDSQSSFNRQRALRDDIEDINNFESSNVSRYEDSVSINTGIQHEKPSRPELENVERGEEAKTPEKPVMSRAETVSSESTKEVQAHERSSSSSRPELVYTEKAKEVQMLEKPSPSRRETVCVLKAKGVKPQAAYKEKAKEVQAPKKPFTSRAEAVYTEKEKEVQGNNSWMPTVADAEVLKTSEPVDDESASSSSAEESGYESEDREVNNTGWRMLDGSCKEVNIFRLLVNSINQDGPLGGEADKEEDNADSSVEDQSEEEDQIEYDSDGFLIVRPPRLVKRFGIEEPESPPEKSEIERQEERLWEELAYFTNPNYVDNQLPLEIQSDITTDESPAARCKKGRHDLCLDIEIGLKCIHCGFVETEIRNMDTSEWGEKNMGERRKGDRYEEEESSNFVGEVGFEASKNGSNEGCDYVEGTVWDKIPGVKSQMYPHQREGFEFIWKNLAGTIMLNELKFFENSDETGGCIMSHAPGTGKTRLTIMFLQAYLSCFPNCKPVVIAPASLLLTWAEEFKKWNISMPFHNLGNLEFTGSESKAAVDLLMQKNSSARTNNEIRMVKIYSWIKAKSILGISYNLYEKLAGVKVVSKKGKKKVKPNRELNDIRKILMGMPGLLILDEAHTPRNQRSCIWKTLSKVETQKRILLSGTPFQNNFQELCNVLGLARPKYLEKLTATLKKSGMTATKRGRKAMGQVINNRGIEELKTVMFPFVHVHKGSILQKSLPGLRECVVVLNPPELQKRVLKSIEVTHNKKIKNVFETEHKLSLVSVHPSLVSHCKLTAKESLTINAALLEQLKKIRLDTNQSVKTRFLMEFISLCVDIKEKVLVFSQYIDPLKLIKKHLVSRFNWKEDVEVLYMHGKLEQKQRQVLINEFNDPKSKAKVLLASTKACSEGINLVGASRVILLDVVWNPAVERQAISRAYRIGQQKIVYTYHLVAKGTPEGPKYCKQAHKDRISELVFACSKQEKGKKKVAGKVIEDKVLDTMVQHPKLADMFDNLIIQPKEADLVDGFSILMP